LSGTIFLTVFFLIRKDNRRLNLRNFQSMFIINIPFAVITMFILWGRSITGKNAASYAGTSIRLNEMFLPTLGKSLTASLPGASWGLSRDTLGGAIDVSTRSLVSIFTLIVVSSVIFGLNPIGRSIRFKSNRTSQKVRICCFIFGPLLLSYWLLGAGLQSMTIKVQDETLKIGYVYTHYAVGFSVVVCCICLVIFLLDWSRISRPFLVASCSLAIVFATVQSTINWKLSTQLRAMTIPNQQLTSAFSEKRPYGERCRALQVWTAGNWPPYYEEGMVAGLQQAFQHFHGVKFCDAYVPNP
jgi:hypothetical protein